MKLKVGSVLATREKNGDEVLFTVSKMTPDAVFAFEGSLYYTNESQFSRITAKRFFNPLGVYEPDEKALKRYETLIHNCEIGFKVGDIVKNKDIVAVFEIAKIENGIVYPVAGSTYPYMAEQLAPFFIATLDLLSRSQIEQYEQQDYGI